MKYWKKYDFYSFKFDDKVYCLLTINLQYIIISQKAFPSGDIEMH